MFEADFRDATVVTLYLLTTLNLKLRPKLLDMRPGTRVVSHVFRMGDWEPDETAKTGASEIYLWVVPAKVAGRWRVDVRDGATFELALEQRYQRVAAKMLGERHAAARDERPARRQRDPRRARRRRRRSGPLAGRVDGDRIDGADGAWRAVRLKP